VPANQDFTKRKKEEVGTFTVHSDRLLAITNTKILVVVCQSSDQVFWNVAGGMLKHLSTYIDSGVLDELARSSATLRTNMPAGDRRGRPTFSLAFFLKCRVVTFSPTRDLFSVCAPVCGEDWLSCQSVGSL
jgi:hypothetical protein